jgi:hypothetical protein
MSSQGQYSFTKKQRTKEEIYPTTNSLKTVYVNIPLHLIYNIASNYLLLDDNAYIDNSTNYAEIAFAFDKDWAHSNYSEFEPIKDFLRLNKINALMYDIHSQQSLSILIGYENIVIGSYLTHVKVLSLMNINSLSLAVDYLSDFSCRVYYVVPDLIFKEGIVHDENSTILTNSTNRAISYYVYYDQTMQFLKNSEKYPLYRIVLPMYYNKSDNTLFNIEKPSIHSNADFIYYARSTFESNELAKAFLKIHKHNVARNYSIWDNKAMFVADNFYFTATQPTNYILCQDSELTYENLSKDEHYKTIKGLKRE